MRQMPQFLQEGAPQAGLAGVHRPSLSSHRGERIAWLCTLGAGAGSWALSLQIGQIPTVGLGLTVFFGAASLLISFGRWVDRGTTLRLDEEGVVYRSPLRRTKLAWRQIRELWAVEAGGCWRVGVRGEGEGFAFRTQATVGFRSMAEMPVGFPSGEQVAGRIRSRAGLASAIWERGRWVCR